jgi:hypothetical protein
MASLPVLLIGSLFSRYAAGYELLLDLMICACAIIVVQRAACRKEYFWAAGFVAIAVIFSPLTLAIKTFLFMGFTGIAAFATLRAAWKPPMDRPSLRSWEQASRRKLTPSAWGRAKASGLVPRWSRIS